MKLYKALIFSILFSILLTSCFEDGDDNLINSGEINEFVWKGMNSWYFWQTEVNELADNIDSATYQELLNEYDTPKDFFNSLRFDYSNTDRFSWFIEDYIVQLQAFQGISKSFGLDFEGVQINNEGDVIIYITYVADNSPASNANIKRGDIINAINNQSINTDNYSNLASKLFGETVTLSFVFEDNGNLNFIEDKTIAATTIEENPVHFRKIFPDINGKKVGYLVYNGFRSSYNDELNDAFGFFKNEAIDELILDLRLNGGGSVGTAIYLASMIHANAGTDVFGYTKYNQKHANEDYSYHFENTLAVINSDNKVTGSQPINRLTTINSLYVLTSGGTASASELIINGLKPFIPVKLFGTTTYGKNVGSITLYDSPGSDYEERSSANQGHLNAMQPIVFKSFNKNGESDYTQGFEPDGEVIEYEYWNNILPFGDENEVVLKAALDDIRGLTTKSSKKSTFSKALKADKLTKKFKNEMYIENFN